MIKLKNYEVMGWDHAIRGMRNPMNSWDKSDTGWVDDDEDHEGLDALQFDFEWMTKKVIGPNDYSLMMMLRNAGTDHRKFMRMITVYVDITAPLYWWKEFDTYKVGTVANSCSTMHKIHEKEFTMEDFSCEHLISCFDYDVGERNVATNAVIEFTTITTERNDYLLDPQDIMRFTISMLNKCREMFLETKDKKYWWQMIQLLPSSYNQKRTVMLNYEVLANMYKSRKNHKLDEWRELCAWIEGLPYSELITCEMPKEATDDYEKRTKGWSASDMMEAEGLRWKDEV